MLTFEKVLSVFGDILDRDPLYEIVNTSHGYTLLGWEPGRGEWYSAQLLDTPQVMLDALVGISAEFMEDQLTGGEWDLTKAEEKEIQVQCAELVALCQAE